jgi:hypothetical protein
MKNRLLSMVLMGFTVSWYCAAHAEGVAIGSPIEVFADPSDVVVALTGVETGGCVSQYYVIQRTKENFKELNAVVLTALSSGKRLRLFVISCTPPRSIVTHGSVFVDQ